MKIVSRKDAEYAKNNISIPKIYLQTLRIKILLPDSRWNHNLEISSYVLKDDYFMLPIYQADKGWLHLEARYNYEEMNTVSAWFGYNFTGGKKFQYKITPLAGAIAGSQKGIGTGLELTFEFAGFELYSESEYIFDLQSRDGSFFYTWTDFTYSPFDWMWFGPSSQLTKPYISDLDVQMGFMLGGEYKWFGLTGYIYNLNSDDQFAVIALSVNFP